MNVQTKTNKAAARRLPLTADYRQAPTEELVEILRQHYHQDLLGISREEAVAIAGALMERSDFDEEAGIHYSVGGPGHNHNQRMYALYKRIDPPDQQRGLPQFDGYLHFGRGRH